ncbi:DUF6093 family protein [Arthrobacter sp. 260]|uniref:DUF6093 family protein n=1 Tax=Arthrobacter sp. 260 TaxID=2735314 RepID=UPI001491A830|nr:DUF6093 family protein [Arthrobacter sp. 260]NOJ59755.1 hypothetical protein [Arthrobacter sp. 260]
MRLGVLLKSGQRAAERLMVDRCKVARTTGESVFNPATGKYEPSLTTTYEGKCRLQTSRTQAANPEAGGAVFTVERLDLQLPVLVELSVGEVAELVESINPMIVGNKYRVTGLAGKTHETKRTYSVEVVS